MIRSQTFGIGRMAGMLLPLLVLSTEGASPQQAVDSAVPDGGRPAAGSRPSAPVLSLEEAVRMALRNNRQLEDARLGLEGAEGLVREAWGSVYPKLDLNASYTRNLTVPATFLPAIFFDPDAGPDELAPIRFGADNNWNLQLYAEQPLFQAGVFLGVGAAERYRALQNETVRGRAQEIGTRVRTAYYDVLLAQEGLRLSENSLTRVEQTLGETRAMFDAGLASEYDVLRLQVEKSNLEPNVRRSRNAVAAATRTLAVELGLEPSDTLRLEGSLTGVDLDVLAEGRAGRAGFALASAGAGAGASAKDILQRAREERSDLRQLELTESLRQTELRVEQVGYLPTVTLFGTYSINAQGNGSPNFFGESSAQRAYGRQVGIQVSLPLFAGFQRPARIDQKRAALQQARTQLQLAEAQAEHEIETLFDQRQESLQRAEAQRAAVQQAQRGYDIARAQYREGISGQLEVTDAELALRQSEYNYAQAVYDYLVARAQLDRALGSVPFVDDNGATPLRTAGIR